jgi:hypothetical protein
MAARLGNRIYWTCCGVPVLWGAYKVLGDAPSVFEDAAVDINHGVPERTSTSALDKLRVVEVTAHNVRMRGESSSGGERGGIDHRTGRRWINWYTPYDKDGKRLPSEVVFNRPVPELEEGRLRGLALEQELL